ncbi:MAG: hypothetical protein IKD04_07855 [Clostridia bacterium]|nr:hypothetical protein [Clostridia bacterium]
MLYFIIGLIAGGIVGFGVCAILSVHETDSHTEETVISKNTGDSDARNE